MIILLLQMKVQGANGSNEEDRKCINQCGCAYISQKQQQHNMSIKFLSFSYNKKTKKPGITYLVLQDKWNLFFSEHQATNASKRY